MQRLFPAAERGDADAQFNLGIYYQNQRGGRGEAIKWLLKAAQQGLPRAQCKLAEIYADGSMSQREWAKACLWYLLAMASSSGVHRLGAQTGYERVSSRLTPAQLDTARRLAEAWKTKRQGAASAVPPPSS